MRLCLLFLALFSGSAPAAPSGSLTVGVFLPTTLNDGQQRFDFGERLAAALSTATSVKATASNYAKHSDFVTALKAGKIDVAVVDAWIAAQTPESMVPVALASMSGNTRRRWAVIAKSGSTVSSLQGKKLAITRGAGGNDGSFVTNAIFEGALPADKTMKLTSAPSVESALRMWSLGTTDAALVPASLAPHEATVLYQSAPLPIAVLLVAKPKLEAVKTALGTLAVAPFDGFKTAGVEEVAGLRRLIASGPPPRPPVWADSPPLPLDASSLVSWKGLQPTFPPLTDLVSVSKELPDD